MFPRKRGREGGKCLCLRRESARTCISRERRAREPASGETGRERRYVVWAVESEKVLVSGAAMDFKAREKERLYFLWDWEVESARTLAYVRSGSGWQRAPVSEGGVGCRERDHLCLER